MSVMWIHPSSVIMNYNLLCNRIMCCLKLRFCNTSKTFLTRNGTHNISQFCSVSWNFHKKIHISSQKSSEESMEDTGESEDLSVSLSKNILLEDHSEQFRNTLYPDSDDLLISQLKSCDSIKDLFTTMNENMESLTSSHYCQVLLVLYDILHLNNCLAYGANLVNLPKNIENELPQPLSAVVLNILDFLKQDVEKLTPEELVCCLLYSKRLGIDIKHPSVQIILMEINNLLLNRDAETFSISALSRLTITFDNQTELWSKLFLIKTLPLIYIHFDKCQSVEEFRALTISMLSTVYYLREDFLVEYEALTEEFIRKGLLTREHRSAIVKAVVLLNHIYHKPAARHMTYKLLRMLQGHLDKMFPPHLLEIQKVVLQQLEPHNTLVELIDFKKRYLFVAPSDDAFLYYYIPLVRLPMDAKGSQVLKMLIAKSNSVDSLLNAQVHLTTAMPAVCQLYWSKLAELLQLVTPGDLQTLIRVCFRYMQFSYRMAAYHHRQFESVALSLVARELVAGTTAMQPRQFADLASFVLTVDPGRRAARLSSDVLSRLLAVTGQLDAQTCLWVSRGLGERLRRSKDVHALLQVDSALNERTRELLKTTDPKSIRMFNTILRSCINRKQSMESDLMQDVMNRWQMLDWSQMTSRSLRNLVYNLHKTSALIPAVVDRMVEYCLANSVYVTVDTLGKLVFLCYHLGHTPRHADRLCSHTANLATRHGELLNGLSLLQVALALSFFNHLPSALVRVIFTVDFLERLDDEIKQCFAKDRYPMRVRQTLMELNRSVCVDQPEADVPWFHAKFCEERKSLGQLEVVPKSLLFMDVYSTLLTLVGGGQNIGTQTFTPYGYVLDMQVNFDASLNPVPFRDAENVVHKLALLLYHGDSYTVVEQRLKGYHQMKQRHLEILGYRVIGLTDSLWNAMFMTEPKAKLEYLRNLIWSS